MSGGDVAVRFTWSTTHVEIYIFASDWESLLLFFLFLSLSFSISNFFWSLFSVCIVAAESEEFSLTITNANVLLPFTSIYTLDFLFAVSSQVIHAEFKCMRIFDIVCDMHDRLKKYVDVIICRLLLNLILIFFNWSKFSSF